MSRPAPLFRKILIANRGEIAVRVIRACREMEIEAVAVYSEADRNALHVRLADEAYCIGPPPSRESYLRIEAILEAARRSGAEAVHPGYGFLAENAAFARACARSGLTFIGPPPEAMESMGLKTAARKIMSQAGVPIVPGTMEGLPAEEERVLSLAAEIGYPVMIKADAGGGGKGLRLVRSPEEVRGALRAAASEARSSFGDATVYLEKYIDRPRHIEIQVLGDRFGNMIHLGERECSIQRRHQKVVEECPSPAVTPEMRAAMGKVAVRAAQAVGYYNAGTVEFLVDREMRYFFLEMNTRLQVEHPVTEMVTGFDLVKLQILVAAGRQLPIGQEDVRWQGSAIECRIYAEDPARGFLPSPGVISGLRQPGGPGVRDDSAIYEGCEISIHYDPLISKLVAWGRTRADAIERMSRALEEYKIRGIKTTIPFHLRVMHDARFARGEIDTAYIDELLARERAKASPPGDLADGAAGTGARQAAPAAGRPSGIAGAGQDAAGPVAVRTRGGAAGAATPGEWEEGEPPASGEARPPAGAGGALPAAAADPLVDVALVAAALSAFRREERSALSADGRGTDGEPGAGGSPSAWNLRGWQISGRVGLARGQG